YTLHSAVGANPDHRENYQVHKVGPRIPAINTTVERDNYIVNYKDAVTGFVVNGTLPVAAPQGVVWRCLQQHRHLLQYGGVFGA
ncbi:MAG: hypothetical protein Q9183_005965, partial [Haloplaca sp. 2 TL-2023]